MHGTRSYMVSSLLDCISSSRSRKSRKFVAVGSICTYIQYNREELIVKKVCFFLLPQPPKYMGFVFPMILKLVDGKIKKEQDACLLCKLYDIESYFSPKIKNNKKYIIIFSVLFWCILSYFKFSIIIYNFFLN